MLKPLARHPWLTLLPILVCSATSAQEVPKPALAPKSWELKFNFTDPERIEVVLPGDDHPTTYWYVRYRVENDTDQDIQFFPSVELVTSSLNVVVAGDQISPSVYDAIIDRHKVTEPFMVRPRHVYGTLLQGEDNAKSSVAVFSQFDPKDNAFSIFFSGLSGEIQRIPNPTFNKDHEENEDNPRVYTLRKTLAIKYSLPGDEDTRRLAKPVRVDRYWEMR